MREVLMETCPAGTSLGGWAWQLARLIRERGSNVSKCYPALGDRDDADSVVRLVVVLTDNSQVRNTASAKTIRAAAALLTPAEVDIDL